MDKWSAPGFLKGDLFVFLDRNANSLPQSIVILNIPFPLYQFHLFSMQSETVLNLNRKEWNKNNITRVFQNAILFTNHMLICVNAPVVSGTIWCSWEVLCSAVNPERRTSKQYVRFTPTAFQCQQCPRHPLCRDSKWTLIHRNALISRGSGQGRCLNTALLLDWPFSLPHLHTSIHGIYNSKGLESPMLPLVPLHTRSFFL